MSNQEKFEALKKELVTDNEATYGKELRQKYGDEAIDSSNQKMMSMSKYQFEQAQKLGEAINEKLKEAFKTGDAHSELAQEVCEMHQQWICMYWGAEKYSKEAHQLLAQTYVDDERFKKYYDKIEEGCAEFLYQALSHYCRA